MSLIEDLSGRSLRTSDLPKQPYPGLRPYSESEWRIFFGRERMVFDIVAKIMKSRFVVVHGDSGCGKSSLMRAGVIPHLETLHSRNELKFYTGAMKPRGGPMWAFATAIHDCFGDPEKPNYCLLYTSPSPRD